MKWFFFLMPSIKMLKVLPNHQEGQEREPGAIQPQLDLWEGSGANNLENNLGGEKKKNLKQTFT